MSKVSIIIPSRNERFLVKTVNDLLAKATGEIQIIVVLDGGPWPDSEPLPYDKVAVVRHLDSRGTRAAINTGAKVATGEFIMKCDAHCMFDYGFDEKLKSNCEANWVVVPRRKRLDAEAWAIQDVGKPDIDYEYLQWHPTDLGGWGHNIIKWDEKNADESLKSIPIDDMMCMQASCWFLPRDWFDYLELMDAETYGPLMNEGEEIAFKSWLSGNGRVVVNKNTWYAHLRKGNKYGRGYPLPPKEVQQGAIGVRKWLTDSAWRKQTRPFSWLIEKFNPPGWPENWQDITQSDEQSLGSDGNGHADAAAVEVHDLAEQPVGTNQVSATGLAVAPRRVLSNDTRPTLQRLLAKFNLNPHEDYSKATLPICLHINRRQIAELFRDLGFKIGAEIGTAEGEYAELLCEANPELILYCVDPWQSYGGYRDYTKQDTLDRLFEEAQARLCSYPGIAFIKAFSTDAAKDFKDGSLDFCYVDANHAFEYVVADIAAWLPKIRPGGIIAGHDYSNPKGKQFGVIQAVQGWTAAYHIAPWFTMKGEYEAIGDRSHSWMWVKK